MNKADLPPLVLIAGPTASGKSALAMALADLTPSTIINADSMQVYRDLRVVTARPSPDDEARHPHRLFGHVDGSTIHSAPLWALDATNAIAAAHADGRLPILVGGTGLYIRTLLDGIAPIPPIDDEIRSTARALEVDDAFRALTVEDAEAAARIGPKDTQRIARALEVVRGTGHPLAYWQARHEGGIADKIALSPFVLLPPRGWLRQRCDERFNRIFRDGQDEVAALLTRELDEDMPVMRAIGVGTIAWYLRGIYQEGEAVRRGSAFTRQYAKRQYTWLATQTPQEWYRERTAIDTQEDLDRVTCLLKGRLTL